MARVIITITIMPESPETDLVLLEQHAGHVITAHEGKIAEAKTEPIAFGLKALKITFSKDESTGSTDAMEEELRKIKEVVSAEVTAVSRAMG